METITISAFSEDFSEKSYKFHYGKNRFEFVPKSQVKFIENGNGKQEFGTGIESRYFELPIWLFNKLQGKEFYGN
jgi:hypothetical protein